MREDETYRQERPVVYLIGIGMGGEDQLTGRPLTAWREQRLSWEQAGC